MEFSNVDIRGAFICYPVLAIVASRYLKSPKKRATLALISGVGLWFAHIATMPPNISQSLNVIYFLSIVLTVIYCFYAPKIRAYINKPD
jgi:hypothetical protein